MNINDASTTSAISHVPAFRISRDFGRDFGVMWRMRNISLLCLVGKRIWRAAGEKVRFPPHWTPTKTDFEKVYIRVYEGHDLTPLQKLSVLKINGNFRRPNQFNT